MDEIRQRLMDLEVRSSFQEELIDELNQVVTECNLQIQKLTHENRTLQETLRSLAPDLPESPDE